MLAYVGRRLIWSAVTLFLSSLIIFAATQILPGDVASMMLGTFATEESLVALRQRLGLNDPAVLQYLRWLGRVLQGDLGTSMRMNIDIAPLLWQRLSMSLLLAGISLVVVIVLGLGLGVAAALSRGRVTDRLISTFILLGVSVPEFATGSVLILAFADVLPPTGYAAIGEGVWRWLAHLVLPVATLTIVLLAHITRMTRSSMIETLHSAYVRTALLKGLPWLSVMIKHALRNAMLPTLTVLGINVGYMIGGIVVVESVFAYPGLGRLMLFAVQQRDIPLIQACALAIAAVFLMSSVAADLLYAYLNPRLRPG